MGWLDPEELKQLLPAETAAFPAPIPTQSVSSDEFMPAPQTAKQREFEARVKAYGAEWARRQDMSRRAFFKTAPQWQIEALRRLEIPEDMQQKYGFQPLGAADGPVKTAILGGNNARLYKYPIMQKSELSHDRFAQLREQYEQEGSERSNRTYGYIRRRLA